MRRAALCGLVCLLVGAPAGVRAQATAPRAVPEAEAIVKFRLRDRLDTYGAGARKPGTGTVVEVVEGDLHVAGNLLADWSRTRASAGRVQPLRAGDRAATTVDRAVGLVVTGNLTVDGAIINEDLNGGPFVLVLGETRARAMFAGGAELRFERRATFADAVVGCYNDGSVKFPDGVVAPVVISEDHDFQIRGGTRSPYFDMFNGEGDPADLAARLHPDVKLSSVGELDVEAHLLPRIRQGLPVVRATKP